MIEQLKNSKQLTHTERDIAKYILEFPRIIIETSLEDLADQCHVSQASIIRLCKKMGCKGFSDFKTKLALEMTTISETSEEISIDLPFDKPATTHEITNTFYNMYSKTLDYEFKNLDILQLRRAAKLLQNADLIHIYGRGESLIIAEDFHYKMMRIGFHTSLETLNGFQEAHSFSVSDTQLKQVAIVISQYVNSLQVQYIVDELNANQIPFILLTATQNPWPYDMLAEVTLKINSPESRHKMGSFVSRNAMLFVLDCLFAEIFSLNYEQNVKNLKEFTKRKEQRNYYYRSNIDN
ncbi:SIS domain-containing protein [Streptococcus sp. zg-86]|uniref:SIS domain-containing protein n=1 Tax=Streptococcus zhangguiae TaxID=2664091 RepID=A0A6I4RAF6_9STRE|nr:MULTISPECIES: MurR/RpiR family transcriptional regulator [unclassified Streptococcus]MTB64502.1 SIS domain-containing protein [Streptococcus sp. zg-86]MTB90808.1 SIS domain-containing protein [Streptococcus sp. zg-36]MWV56489.1 SIS domain-containing protein [Streptococcus sp. zg-70]QTH47305.1 MurR/RpiR family transcriptional regulator [Streptococcus sp. zg-86]